MTIRRLQNTEYDRNSHSYFVRKLAVYEKTLDPNIIVEKTPYNDTEILDDAMVTALVFEEGGTTLGYLVGKIQQLPPWYGGGDYGHVEYIFTEECARGKGIATELFSVFKDWCTERQIHTIKLRVFSNSPARRLYKKWGFASLVEVMVLSV